MASKILVAYASKHGTTREVAESIAATLGEQHLDVDIEDAAHVRDIAPYDALVVGGGLYMGKWHSDAQHLLKRHRHELAEKRLAVFGMGRTRSRKRRSPSQASSSIAHLLRRRSWNRSLWRSSAVRSNPRPGGSRSTSCPRSMRATGTRSTAGLRTSPRN